MRTHEDYIRDVAIWVTSHADINPTEQAELAGVKLVYGSGPTGTRGVTFYGRWKANDGEGNARPFVEVSAFGQESIVQLTGTTIHELGHVLAGWNAGHGKLWHEACARLGLIDIQAAGTDYSWENFQPWVRDYCQSIAPPDEGSPTRSVTGSAGIGGGIAGTGVAIFKGMAFKGCQAGIGTRGGKSRGIGSGSRLRLFECECHKPVKVRLACDEFDAVHNPCAKPFHRVP